MEEETGSKRSAISSFWETTETFKLTGYIERYYGPYLRLLSRPDSYVHWTVAVVCLKRWVLPHMEVQIPPDLILTSLECGWHVFPSDQPVVEKRLRNLLDMKEFYEEEVSWERMLSRMEDYSSLEKCAKSTLEYTEVSIDELKQEHSDCQCNICYRTIVGVDHWTAIFDEANKSDCNGNHPVMLPDEEWSSHWRLYAAFLLENIHNRDGLAVVSEVMNAISNLEQAYYRLKHARQKAQKEHASDMICIQAVRIKCGHIFGHECISQWARESRTCPFCRRAIDTNIRNDEFETGTVFQGPEPLRSILRNSPSNHSEDRTYRYHSTSNNWRYSPPFAPPPERISTIRKCTRVMRAKLRRIKRYCEIAGAHCRFSLRAHASP
jgi:hypothetical protein